MKWMATAVLAGLMFAATSADAQESAYKKLREARPDGRMVRVNNLVLQRDQYRLTFRTGTFYFLAPVENRTFGAVFVGDGSYLLQPATSNERKHLALVLGDASTEVLTDSFDKLVLLFSDQTASEIEKSAAIEQGPADAKATSIYTDYLEQQKKKYRMNLHLRILMDLLKEPHDAGGVFLAPVDGKKYAPGLIAIDPLGIGNLAAGYGFVGGEEVAFLSLDDVNGGFWYLGSTKGAVNGRGKPLLPVVDAVHYDVDTTIASNLLISGNTSIQVRPRVGGIRVIPIHILPKLRLKEASITVGGKTSPAEIVQEDDELGKLARLFKEQVADSNAGVVSPTPLAADADVVVSLRYEGKDVLQSVGVDSYSVRARESWYPNVGTFTDLATYSLTYHFPKANTVVSTGKMSKQETVEKQTTSHWESEQPIRVAGFNYGRFDKLVQKDGPSGLELDIYTNREQHRFAHDTLVDAQNSARTATAFFGRVPSSSVSVTQQSEWFFGQSWPSLVFLPTLAMTSSTERVDMLDDEAPMAIASINEFAKTVGWHEMAHQWWGHLVGWESYRDQWLSEGFAEFTSALVLQFTESGKKYDDFWERKRETILQKGGGPVANSDSGPITDGFRVSTKSSPSAGQAIIYDKGAYVVHMLRMMLRDSSQKNADEKFMAMMRDFITSYSGKNPSTLDFQHVVERHMTPQMNAAENGTMDYFFRQWVDGTSIPKIKSDLRSEPGSAGKYRISGTVFQEGISEDFISVVPLYVEFSKGQIAKIGSIRLIGTKPQTLQTELALPEKPSKISVNALHDVLSR